MYSNAFCSTSIHLNVALSDVSVVRGCSQCDRIFHIYLQCFKNPTNAHTFCLLFGGIVFTIACTFYFLSDTILRHPDPQVFHTGFQRIYFSILQINPLSLSFFSISSNFSRLFYQSTSVIINWLSMYDHIKSNLQNILFVLF